MSNELSFRDWLLDTHFIPDREITRDQKSFDVCHALALCADAPNDLEVYDDLLRYAARRLRTLEPLDKNVKDQLNILWGCYCIEVERRKKAAAVDKPRRRPLFD